MRKITVSLYKYVPTVGDSGIVSQGKVLVCGLKGNIIPLKGEIAKQEQGFRSNPSYKFYTRDFDVQLLEGNFIRYSGKDYTIVSVLNYGKIYEVTLNEFVGENLTRTVVKSYTY